MKRRIPNLDSSMRHLFRVYRGIPHKEIFFYIARVDGHEAIGPADLMKLTETPRSTISRQISRLIEAGLIRSVADPKHRRSHLLTLTDRGRAIQEELIGTVKTTITPQALVGMQARNEVSLPEVIEEQIKQIGSPAIAKAFVDALTLAGVSLEEMIELMRESDPLATKKRKSDAE